MDWIEQIKDLPTAWQESIWLHDRLETLSVKESIILSAAVLKDPPQSGADVINHLLRLRDYEVCYPVQSESQLGEFIAKYESGVPPHLMEYVDTQKLGASYAERHPGVFTMNAYVISPRQEDNAIRYDGTNLVSLEDDGWSVKLKLASERVPEGVWLRLPDYSEFGDERPDEIRLALDALGVDTINECTLLDAKCILPEAGDLMEQYDDLADLIYDGQNLGFVLDERGQGMPGFMEKFAAALEYENCHRLGFALDISQNLRCYNLVTENELHDFAVRELRAQGMSDEILASGCIDLDAYADDLLTARGYTLTANESAYIARNEQRLFREHTQEALPGMVLQ